MPFFVPDISAYQTSVNFAAITARNDIAGVILKATQGMQYAPAWFVENFPRARAAAGARYGSTFFRGVYHFGMPNWRGDQQADYCMAHIQRAGGLGSGDMPIAWDLESSSNTTWTSVQQIVDISSQFSERIKQHTGKQATLYAGSLIRDKGIKHHMGFGKLWTPHLDMSKAGWSLSQYALWQYAGGNGFYNPAYSAYGFPLVIPGFIGGGQVQTDMNVVMKNGAFASSMSDVSSALVGGLSLTLLLGAAALAYMATR